MLLTALFLAGSLIAIAYLSSRQTQRVPRKTLIAALVGMVVIRVGFYVAFRLFDERDVFFVTGMFLAAATLLGIACGSVAVWKQMGPRNE